VRTGRLAMFADDGSPEAAISRLELAACRAKFEGPNRLRWEAPPGSHDDFVVSAALCLRATSQVGAPRVALGRRREPQQAGPTAS